ncbi:MAG: hypothetical protein ACTSQO_06740 [Candidatus Helarchaeota archaeon]
MLNIDFLMNENNINWEKIFEKNKECILYDKGIIKYAILSTELKGIKFFITINFKRISLNKEEFGKYIELCIIFSRCLSKYNIESILIDHNEFSFYSKNLEYSINTQKIVLKLFYLIVIIFEKLGPEL